MNTGRNLELKRIIATPQEEKPHFDWKKLVAKDRSCTCEYYNASELADKVGETVVDAALLEGQTDIFSEENKTLVIALVKQICQGLKTCEVRPPNQAFVDDLIEEIFVRNGRLDLAQAFVAKCNFTNEYYKKLKDGRRLNLIRRDGSVVPWNIEKIKHAVEQAFIAQHQDPSRAEKISYAVTKNILDDGLSFIHIENVQDCVQEELMRQGEYKIAEAYILYRAERAKLRADGNDLEQEKLATKSMSEESMLLITGNDGETFFWDGSELRKRIAFANDGLDSHLSQDEIFFSLKEGIVSNIDISTLRTCIIKNARKLIEKDPVFALFAARMQLLYLYEDVLGWNCSSDTFDELNEKQSIAFKKYIEQAVADGLLHRDMLQYDLSMLSQSLRIDDDKWFDAIALQSMEEHYFMRDSNDKILETPQMLWMRVAMGVFLARQRAENDVIALYNILRERKFCLATPTLYYAGTVKPQMMSSYVYALEDDMKNIMMRGISDNAFIAKWGGGIAGSWSHVRSRNSRIAGTRGKAPGVIPFLQLHQHQLAIANQGTERRRGRGAAYLEIWHNDILEFVNYKKKYGVAGVQDDALGTVVWVPDIFMRRLEQDGDWTLLNTDKAYSLHDIYGEEFDAKYEELERQVTDGKINGQKIACRDIWQKIMQRIFETGYPKIAFKDTCNRSNMCKNGMIHSCNLCLEHTLNTTPDETAVCNTGALDICKHLTPDGSLDYVSMKHTIRIATRALDAMIDANFFPSDAAKGFAERYRAIGLGMMGLQNALYEKNLPFGSEEAIAFSEECAEVLAYETILASSELSEQYGPCDVYSETEWSKGKLPFDNASNVPVQHLDWDGLRNRIKSHGVRNAYMNACSPTRKIARLLSCYPELSPATKNVFTKRFDDNYEMMIISPELVRILKRTGVWNKSIHKQIRYFDGDLAAIDGIPDNIKDVFATAYMIDSAAIIDGAARRQQWIDQSQSFRLFLGSPNLRNLSAMFVSAWKKGIKGVYDVKSAGFFSNPASSDVKSLTAIQNNTHDGAHHLMNVLDNFRLGK